MQIMFPTLLLLSLATRATGDHARPLLSRARLAVDSGDRARPLLSRARRTGKTTSSSQLEQMEVKVRGAGVPRASKLLTPLLALFSEHSPRIEPHSLKVTGGVRVGHNMSNPTQFAGPAALQTIRDADTAREDYITEGEFDREDYVKENSIFGQAAAAVQTIRYSPLVLYAEDYDEESVPGPLGLNSNTRFFRERDGERRPLVLKSMEWPRRARSPTFDNPEFHFACEVGFQQVAAKHGLAPAIVEYGWKRNGIGKKFHILMERKGKTLREWWKEAAEADKARVKDLTYELFDQLDMLGLHMEDPNPGNVLVETSPELRVFAIDFDPDTMDTNPKATREPRGFATQVLVWLYRETAGFPSVWTQPWLRRN